MDKAPNGARLNTRTQPYMFGPRLLATTESCTGGHTAVRGGAVHRVPQPLQAGLHT